MFFSELLECNSENLRKKNIFSIKQPYFNNAISMFVAKGFKTGGKDTKKNASASSSS